MDDETKAAITEVLTLVEDNLHTSASSVGLKRRAENLRLMEYKLIKLLYPDEEPEDCEELVDGRYWKYIKERGE